MTARFENGLSIAEHLMLSAAVAGLMLVVFPATASAQTANKTRIVIEIKNLKIPTIGDLNEMLKNTDNNNEVTQTPAVLKPTEDVETPVPDVPAVTVIKTSKKIPVYPNDGIVPPKKTGTDRVYMHEPEIRAYVCPKMGEDKCNTFLAILAAENGTHECTRDNRGTNKNGSIDIGLTQINWSPSSPYSFEQLQDCKFNLDIALKKYETRGFQPWAAYNSGRYLKHLPAILASGAALKAAAETPIASN